MTASSVVSAKCPDCGAGKQLLISTDFRRLELTCQRGHTWADHRVTVSGWVLGAGDGEEFAAAPTRGIPTLGVVHVRCAS